MRFPRRTAPSPTVEEVTVAKDPSGRIIRIGCAGWAVPKEYAAQFPTDGTHLTRYAGCFPAVEINSSFYRPHQPATYAKWAASVPDDFRFAVKAPKAVTHDHRLVDVEDALDQFLGDATQLGDKLGVVLFQLPPNLSFEGKVAKRFLTALRNRFDGDVALEPRNVTWFEAEANKLVTRFRVARVAADPAVVAAAAIPGGCENLVYYRLHGSPRMYYSAYSLGYLHALAKNLQKAANSASVWCIFDNTAAGAAMTNALEVLAQLHPLTI
jgi:uncharacterized protein YecE (DUF72 family)